MILTLVLSAFLGVGASAQDAARRQYTPIEYYKNFALSACVSSGYKDNDVSADSAAAAAGYLELGNLPLEAHTEAVLLGRQFLSRKYAGISGTPLTLMKCIDYFYSDDLDRLARKWSSPAP